MTAQTFWNQTNPLTPTADALMKLVPHSGQVENPRKNRALEKFRKAVNCYYDLYNNGLCNRATEFNRVFGIASSKYKSYGYRADFDARMYVKVESAMDVIIVKAATEQGIAIDCTQS